jgi:hypothetical protein
MSGSRWARVTMGTGDENVAEVAHDVALDVLQVRQAAEHFGIEGLVLEGIEVDVIDLELGRVLLEGRGVEGHARCSVRATRQVERIPAGGRL